MVCLVCGSLHRCNPPLIFTGSGIAVLHAASTHILRWAEEEHTLFLNWRLTPTADSLPLKHCLFVYKANSPAGGQRETVATLPCACCLQSCPYVKGAYASLQRGEELQRRRTITSEPRIQASPYTDVTLITHVLPNTNTHPTTSNTPFTPCWLVWVADACWDVCIHCDVSSKAQFSDPAAGSELQLLSSRRNIPVNISIYMFRNIFVCFVWFISFVHVITRTVSCVCVCVRAWCVWKRERESKYICSKIHLFMLRVFPSGQNIEIPDLPCPSTIQAKNRHIYYEYILLIVPVQFSTLWDSVESFICNVWSIFYSF